LEAAEGKIQVLVEPGRGSTRVADLAVEEDEDVEVGEDEE
jgi:hypothetical protein